MKNLNKLHLIFLLLILTGCIKVKEQPKDLQVIVKDIFTGEVLPNRTVHLYSAEKNFLGGNIGGPHIIDKLTTDAQGQVNFVNFQSNGGVSYTVHAIQSDNYSSSKPIVFEKDYIIYLFLYPLLTKKVIIKKPSNIKYYYVSIYSDFLIPQPLYSDTSKINTYYCKFVPEVKNEITTFKKNFEDSIIPSNTLPPITPARSDTSAIIINL